MLYANVTTLWLLLNQTLRHMRLYKRAKRKTGQHRCLRQLRAKLLARPIQHTQ